MVFTKTLITQNKFIEKLPVLLILSGLFVYTKFDLVGFVIFVLAITFLGTIIYDVNFLFPSYLFLVGITAQLPSGYHHIFSYGITGLLLLIWVLQKIYYRENLIIPEKSLFFLIIFYIGLNFISALFSEYYLNGIFITMRITVFFMVVFVFYDWLQTKKRISTVIYTIITIGVVSSLFVIVDFFKSGVIFDKMELVRYGGIFTGVNALGLVLAIGIPFVLHYMIIYRQHKKGMKYLLFFLLMTFTLFLTFSRSAWLAFGICALIITFYHKETRPIIITTITVFIGIILFSENIREFAVYLLRIESSLSGREFLWKGAIEMIKDYPVIGVGPGAIENYIIQYSGVGIHSWWAEQLFFARNNAHNFYLTMGAELGMLGILVAVSIVGLFFIHFFRTKLIVFEYREKSLLITCGAIVMGLFGRSFFEGNALLTNGWLAFDIYFWLIYAIILRIKQFSLTM